MGVESVECRRNGEALVEPVELEVLLYAAAAERETGVGSVGAGRAGSAGRTVPGGRRKATACRSNSWLLRCRLGT